MSSKQIRSEVRLEPDDVLDILIHVDQGRTTGFVLNHRTRTGPTWRNVIRYDTHHGRLHVHRFWRQKEKQVEDLKDEPVYDYGPWFEEARNDIKDN